MIRADLITGFLGSGKTTFIKQYAAYFMSCGEKISILENDHGAVNVDRLLLSELEEAGCNIETVAGACDRGCHYRRFKTKLIALAMQGCDHVIIEPSGIFDTDEFFDVLREEPLDRLYEPGSVITVVDAGLENELSRQARYLLACQCICAGKILLSRTQLCSSAVISRTKQRLQEAVYEFGGKRVFCPEDLIEKTFSELTDEDMKLISCSGYKTESVIKVFRETGDFGTLYLMDTGLTPDRIRDGIRHLFSAEDGSDVMRIKGFARENGQWYEINATKSTTTIAPCNSGQDVIIVIGEGLKKEQVEKYLIS